MLCPLKMVRVISSVKYRSESTAECGYGECAWYMGEGKCAVKVIASAAGVNLTAKGRG